MLNLISNMLKRQSLTITNSNMRYIAVIKETLKYIKDIKMREKKNYIVFIIVIGDESKEKTLNCRVHQGYVSFLGIVGYFF